MFSEYYSVDTVFVYFASLKLRYVKDAVTIAANGHFYQYMYFFITIGSIFNIKL